MNRGCCHLCVSTVCQALFSCVIYIGGLTRAYGGYSDKLPTSAHNLRGPARSAGPLPPSPHLPPALLFLHSSILTSLLVAPEICQTHTYLWTFALTLPSAWKATSCPPLCDCFLLVIYISAQMSLPQKGFLWPHSL